MTVIFGIFLLVINILTFLEIRKNEKKRIHDANIYEQWLFGSLYSIDNKILLPSDKEPVIINKNATVFSPTEDGMAEFNGDKCDLYDE